MPFQCFNGNFNSTLFGNFHLVVIVSCQLCKHITPLYLNYFVPWVPFQRFNGKFNSTLFSNFHFVVIVNCHISKRTQIPLQHLLVVRKPPNCLQEHLDPAFAGNLLLTLLVRICHPRQHFRPPPLHLCVRVKLSHRLHCSLQPAQFHHLPFPIRPFRKVDQRFQRVRGDLCLPRLFQRRYHDRAVLLLFRFVDPLFHGTHCLSLCSLPHAFNIANAHQHIL